MTTPADTPTVPTFVGLDVLAEALDIPERTCRHLAAAGDLPVPVVRVGRRWRVSVDALERLAAQPLPSAHPADFT